MKRNNIYFKNIVFPVILFILGLFVGGTTIYFYWKRTSTPVYTIAEINKQIADITNQKITAFVELQKYFQSKWENVSPAGIEKAVAWLYSELDMKIKYLNQLKEKIAQEEVIKNLGK